jgi:1,4-alpha-glucan branching enzyme
VITVASEGKTPLEVIQQENELLRRTIQAADSSVEQLEQELNESGVAVPKSGPWSATDKGVGPSVNWSPAIKPCDGGILDESRLPSMSEIPEHDGTDCLKWDDSLWSHAEHFKYRWGVYKNIRSAIDEHEGGMDSFTKGPTPFFPPLPLFSYLLFAFSGPGEQRLTCWLLCL